MKRQENKQKIKANSVATILLIIATLFSIVVGVWILPGITFGAEVAKMEVEGKLEKYINYKQSEQNKGTLVQYCVKSKIEYENDYIPIKNSEIEVQVSQIDGKYPSEVKTITKSAQAINGCEYNPDTGKLIIKASNENEKGEYLIICHYDTYTEGNPERELLLKIAGKATLSTKDNKIVDTQQTIQEKVTENIGKLISMDYKTEDIYNGNIKANKINGTEYNTPYLETQEIIVSRKEAQEKIEVSQNSTFIKGEGEAITELGNNRNLVYKSTKIAKEDIINLLGENGTLEILDTEGNNIATINQETQFDEEGKVTIPYNNEPEGIKIQTSQIEKEGILTLEHTKEIKKGMTDIRDTKIKTNTQINQENYENIVDIKDSQTNVDVKISNNEWTNKQQNEVTFDVSLHANTMKDNLFKNPSIRIKLPNQVEKVIIQNSGIFYANGLALQNVYTENNENGNIDIVANLVGSQTEYSANELELSTDVKITATIILKKEIESTKETANLVCTNQYTEDGRIETKNQEINLQIENYKEENSVAENIEKEEETYRMVKAAETNVEGLKLEVAPVKANVNLKEGDIVNEGEFIKYNIKVTNESAQNMENVRIIGAIPEGSKYAELEADGSKYYGAYEYKYKEDIHQKEIKVGTLKPGESSNQYYEVKVKDIPDEAEEQDITSNIEAYVGESKAASYQMMNKVKQAGVKVFLGAHPDRSKDEWNYELRLQNGEIRDDLEVIEIGKEEIDVDTEQPIPSDTTTEAEDDGEVVEEIKDRYVKTKIKLPDEFNIVALKPMENGIGKELYVEDGDLKVGKDNVVEVELLTNSRYYISGKFERERITQETEESKQELTAYAMVEEDNKTYYSNENRVMYEYENVSISMTSSNEGEEVKYEDEIDYEITVKNIGKTNINIPENLYMDLHIRDYLPKNVKPISVTYNSWEQVGGGKQENNEYISTGEFKEVEFKTKKLTEETTKDEDGNEKPNINFEYIRIPYGKSVTIKVKTKAGYVTEKTKIENSASVTGDNITAKTSNTVSHIILPYDYEEPKEPTDPDDPKPPVDPDDPEKPVNPEEPEAKYSIAGMAWIDENEDGQRQEKEKAFAGITAMLVDVKNATQVKQSVQTDTNGNYRFSDLEKGNYAVLFQYNTNDYRITEYQKNGVSNSSNSDAVMKEITLNGEKLKVGMIEVTNLEASVNNLDIGLIKNKICDFKLDKTIKKVTVSTQNGTKQYDYQNEKLAKVEIKAKEINGATIVIEYKIVITNEGELAANIGKVIDYLPEGLTFSSELNKNWSSSTNGQLINTSLSNQKIEAGEKVELTLIATKAMTENNTGTFTNAAEIGEINNSLEIADIDLSNNHSEAGVIISVSTGIIIYLSMTITFVTLIGIAIYLAYKHNILKINKIGLWVILFGAVISLGSVISLAEYWPSTWPSQLLSDTGLVTVYDSRANFTYTGGDHKFSGGPKGAGYCIDHGNPAYNGGYSAGTPKITNTEITVTEEDINYDLEKRNEEIGHRTIGNDYIYGPFSIYCTYAEAKYEFGLWDNNGKSVAGATVCDSNGNSKSIQGSCEFYLKVPIANCGDGVARIKATTTREGLRTELYEYFGTITYYPDVKMGKVLVDKTRRVRKSRIVKNSAGQDVTEYYYVTEYYKEWEEKANQRVQVTGILIRTQYKEFKIWNTQSIEWTDIDGSIELYKEDYDNPDKMMPNVKVNVNCANTGYDSTETTDENGRFLLENMKSNKNYQLTEVETPHYGYRAEAKGEIKVKPGMTVTYHMKNIKHTGNLKIEKKDPDNNSIILRGMGFKIKDSKGQYLIAVDDNDQIQMKPVGRIYLGNLQYTSDVSQATEFTTDNNGIIEIFNILEGDYIVQESSVGLNEAYDVDSKYITWEVSVTGQATNKGSGIDIPVTITRQKSYNTERVSNYKGTVSPVMLADQIVVYNQRKYLKITGTVWQDIEENQKEQQDRDGLFASSSDKALEGITIQLIDTRTGEVVKHDHTGEKMETKTSSQGGYLFEDVMVDGLAYYSVEFQYNGMSYQSVKERADSYPLNKMEVTGHDNQEKKAVAEVKDSSRAAEGPNRDKFNDAYATISYGKSNQYELTYKTSDYESEILFRKDRNENAYNYGYSGNEEGRGPVSGVDEQYIIRANTYNTYSGGLDKIKTATEVRKNSILEIANVNLGVERRSQPDMTLIKELDSIKVSINGADHVYRYGDRYKKELQAEFGDGYNMSPQVRMGSKYGSMSYSRAVYASDVYYKDKNGNTDNELRVKVTYKIGIQNTSSELTNIINEINDYYDSKYYNINEKINVGKQVNEYGDIIESSRLEHTESEQVNTDFYKMKIKDINLRIEPQKDEYVYVQLEVRQEKIVDILNENSKIENLAEISSYSTKDKNNKTYAAIDEDSQPGNMEIGKQTTYEDDTDKAPGLQLILQEERKLDGKVFIDSTTGELKTGEVREGDGTYNTDEAVVKDVTVTLVNATTGEPTRIYNPTSQDPEAPWVKAITTTNDKGEYYIGGFIPDQYKVIYTWGGQSYINQEGQNQLIRVQDYKGTVYKERDRQNNLEWYKARTPRYSDAMDNYDQNQNAPKGSRLQIDEQAAITTNANTHTITNYQGDIELTDGNKQAIITTMDSLTPTFRVNLEYITEPTHYRDEYALKDGKLQMNGVYVVKTLEHQNHLQNVDFGIVERAKQALSLNKRIEKIRLIRPDGSELISGEIEENPRTGERKLKGSVKHAIYIPNTLGSYGQIKLELDSEIAQSARLEISYRLDVTNISELDYINQEYYKYGKGYGENDADLVTIETQHVLDYLDNNITTDPEEAGIGKIIQDKEERMNLIDTRGLLENTEEMRDILKGNKRIIQIDSLNKGIQPKGENVATTILQATKLLGKNEDDIDENIAEIVKTKKSGGASVITTLGSYIPEVTQSEYDDSTSEDVIVIPPTGSSEEYNYTIYMISAIAGLGILVLGIIVIKKFILK